MDPAALVLLGGLALGTSMMTAMVGLGGGIILLSGMLLYFDPLVAIPLHGAIQLVSNSSRAFIQRRHVRWPVLYRFAALLLPAGALGILFARSLPPDLLKAGIGLFVLLAVWAPRALLLGLRPENMHPLRRFYALGGVLGFLNVTAGATGPLLGPFFLNLGLARQGVVGTFAATQMAGHLAKILLFGVAGFAFSGYLGLLALMCALVVAGTWLGSLLLERVDERLFRALYRTALTAIAAKLVLWDGATYLGLISG